MKIFIFVFFTLYIYAILGVTGVPVLPQYFPVQGISLVLLRLQAQIRLNLPRFPV